MTWESHWKLCGGQAEERNVACFSKQSFWLLIWKGIVEYVTSIRNQRWELVTQTGYAGASDHKNTGKWVNGWKKTMVNHLSTSMFSGKFSWVSWYWSVATSEKGVRKEGLLFEMLEVVWVWCLGDSSIPFMLMWKIADVLLMSFFQSKWLAKTPNGV